MSLFSVARWCAFPLTLAVGGVFLRVLPAVAEPATSHSEAAASIIQFDIPRQFLADALVAFSETSDIEYLARSQVLRGLKNSPIKGAYSPEAAMLRLLEGTQLKFVVRNGTYIIKPIPQPKTVVTLPELEEMIVTAQKREQKNQDVPIAITTLSAEALDVAGVHNTKQLYLAAPSMVFHNAKANSGQGLRIRGIGTAVLAGGVEQSVGTIIDGVMAGSSGAGLQELWDIERIEVLRGPQGTLFGKNVSAGAVSQISRDPTTELSAQLKFQYETEYDKRRVDAFVSGPLGENWSYRVAAFDHLQQQGPIKNIVRDEYENTEDREGIRVKLHYEPDQWWLKFNYAYNTASERCCARVFSHIESELLSGLAQAWLVPALERHDLSITAENRISIAEAPLQYIDGDTQLGVYEMGVELPSGHQIKSVTGYRKWQQSFTNDEDTIDRDIASYVGEDSVLELLTQEFQLLSPEDSTLEYVIGGYFFQQRLDRLEPIGYGSDFAPTIGASSGKTTIDSTTRVKHRAVFGHATYYLNDALSAYLGLRLQHESIESLGQQKGAFWLWPTDYPVNFLAAEDSDYSATSGVKWDFNDDQQVYFSLSRGYKGQAIDNPANSVFFRAPFTSSTGQQLTVEDALLEPETVLAFELGSKNFFWDHRIMLNAAVFHSRFKNYQTSAFDNTLNAFRLTNAGVVDTQGLELEWQLLPWSGASFSGHLSWVDARFVEFDGAPCQVAQTIAGTCVASEGGQNVNGKRLFETPEWQFYLAFQQDVAMRWADWYIRANYAWRDDVVFGSDLDPNTTQPAFGMANVSTGLIREPLEISIFVHNVFDEFHTNRIIDAVLWQGAYSSYPEKGRTMGMELTFRY